ncbi:hypothetical protein O988_05448 [Pseudogymnoascus sp. VKM F-3808]|nr:hypothetical protein O988_05448 [Pseudogymnoascus sp. VKM F-3808]
MSDSLRSNSGCWTCRVRRKKCDETSPTCLTCDSLNLPCYGYGPKPNWMDRGVRERKVAKSLRNIVKQTLSLQRQWQPRESQMLSDEPLSLPHLHHASMNDGFLFEDAADASFLLPESLNSTGTSVSLLDESSSPRAPTSPALKNPSPAGAVIAGAARNDTIDLMLTSESWSVVPVQFEEDQATLLMHFFDHVLPLQFRFYNPSIGEGGRGWLLSILIRTKPLYNVALSLAAYHQQSILVQDRKVQCTASLGKLKERHIECIRALRLHIEKYPVGSQGDTCQDNIETLACITLLIALELFTGDTNDWQVHLKAASTVALTCGRKALQIHSSPSSTSNTHELAIRLMGCESWLMRLILEIAILCESKKRHENSGALRMQELVHRATDIKARIELGLTMSYGYPHGGAMVDNTATTMISHASAPPVQHITRVFACGALVYLQVFISGPHPKIAEIQQGVSRTMAALNTLPDKDLVRNLLWPVCIAGCMATAEHELYWRNLVSSVGEERWSFGYPSKVLDIMEECWRLRKGQSENLAAVDWMTAMKNLDMKVLLV